MAKCTHVLWMCWRNFSNLTKSSRPVQVLSGQCHLHADIYLALPRHGLFFCLRPVCFTSLFGSFFFSVQNQFKIACPPQARAIKLHIALALVEWSHAGGGETNIEQGQHWLPSIWHMKSWPQNTIQYYHPFDSLKTGNFCLSNIFLGTLFPRCMASFHQGQANTEFYCPGLRRTWPSI